MKLRAFDLCSGIGGFRIGAALSDFRNDFEFVAYSDSDPYANLAYKAMFDPSKELCLEDIQAFTRFDEELSLIGPLPDSSARKRKIDQCIPDFDFLFAGFPCQPHSLMGNRKGTNDDRGNLFYDIAAILKVKNPNYFLLENVRAIKSVNDGAFFREISRILTKELGYDLQIWSLNASDFGVPQTRRRIFFAGSKEKHLPIMPPVNLNHSPEYLTTWHLLEKHVDARYYLSETILGTILKHEHKGYKRKAEINKLIARPLCKSMHKMHRASQDNYFSDDFINGTFDSISKKVVYQEDPESRIRRITPVEAFRIQSVPENLIKKVTATKLSDTRLYMLAGNAVPPLVVSSVLNHMLF